MDTVVINNITKKFEHTTAIDDLTLTIPTGQMTGIVGADAAGKTTLLRIIIGLLWPIREPLRPLVMIRPGKKKNLSLK